MARSGDMDIEWNQPAMDEILRLPAVEQAVDGIAERGLAIAKANAPVDTGDYQRGLRVEHRESRYRRVARIVGTDEKTLLIESKTGNIARAGKAAKG